jgi:hypothetical protein
VASKEPFGAAAATAQGRVQPGRPGSTREAALALAFAGSGRLLILEIVGGGFDDSRCRPTSACRRRRGPSSRAAAQPI